MAPIENLLDFYRRGRRVTHQATFTFIGAFSTLHLVLFYRKTSKSSAVNLKPIPSYLE